MLSKTNRHIILAYNKGYRAKNGKVISPFSGKPRAQTMHRDRKCGYNLYRFSIRGEEQISYPIGVHSLVAYQKYGPKIFTDGIEIRHLDGNSLNNEEKNINIGTKSNNEQDKPEEIRKLLSINASTCIRKFSDERMKEIRCLRAQGWSYKDLMMEFNISSKGTLHYILNTIYQTHV